MNDDFRSVEENLAADVDSRVRYPSYKSMDEFLDVERLRSLDSYVRSRIKRRIAEKNDPKFYTGPYTLDEDKAGRPGSRMIYLSDSKQPDNWRAAAFTLSSQLETIYKDKKQRNEFRPPEVKRPFFRST